MLGCHFGFGNLACLPANSREVPLGSSLPANLGRQPSTADNTPKRSFLLVPYWRLGEYLVTEAASCACRVNCCQMSGSIVVASEDCGQCTRPKTATAPVANLETLDVAVIHLQS